MARRRRHRRARKRLGVEALEARQLLAAESPLDLSAPHFADVNSDGQLTPLDAVIVLNHISENPQSTDYRVDVNEDGRVSPADALIVLNHIRLLTSSLTPDSTDTWIVTLERATSIDELIEAAELATGQILPVNHRFEVAIYGFSAILSNPQAERIARLPGVESIDRAATYFPHTDASPGFIRADEVWNGTAVGQLAGTQGEGIVIGVIDVGIDPDNPSFEAVGPVDGYQHINPQGAGNFLGACDPSNSEFFDASISCNDKLIGVYNFATDAVDHPQDGDHGAHVASIAAGNVVIVPPNPLPDSVTISGVAPHANIIAYDVCNGPNGCTEDRIIAAIDQAIRDGVDIINLSLGSQSSSIASPFSQAFLTARDQGIFVAASVGNDGPDPNSSRSPALAPWVTGVANTTGDRVIARTLSVTAPGPVPEALTQIAYQPGESIEINADIGPVIIKSAEVESPANHEGCSAFAAGTFSQSFALIDRGTCFFVDKVANAAAAGAIGVIVANNRPGPLVTMANVAGSNIPAVFISQASGEALQDWISDNPATTSVLIDDQATRQIEPANADLVHITSSRGPFTGFDVLVPSLGAPGTNVLAAGANDGAPVWELRDGTSMSSPHIAGAAALLHSIHPNWTPAEIHSALMLTTRPFHELLLDDGNTVASPHDVGSGRVDVAAAVGAGFVLNETTENFENFTTQFTSRNLNLPSFVNSLIVGPTTWTRTVRSTVDIPVRWVPSFTAPDGVQVQVTPPVIELDPGAEATFQVSLNFQSPPENLGEWFFADLTFEPDASIPSLHFPIAARWSDNALGIAVQSDRLVEGGAATSAVVFRTGNTASELNVNLSADALGQLSMPGTIVIPAGATTSAPFSISTIDDLVLELATDINITASAAGIISSTDRVRLDDDDSLSVVGNRRFVYNNSTFDSFEPTAGPSDDAAIPFEKTALLPGGVASAANYTNYVRGINGVVLDVLGLPVANLTASDFEFRMGNDDRPDLWTLAPQPTTVSVRQGAGGVGISRITLLWPEKAITGTWLEVRLKAGFRSGLATADVSYFGNAPGDTFNSGSNAFVDGTDFAGTRDNPHNFLDPAGLQDAFDFTRDGLVDGTDLAVARDHQTNFLTALRLIRPPA